jgi:hypothetical protein
MAVRAARRVEAREGRPIRVPRLPHAGEDEEVEPDLAPEPQPAQPKPDRPKPDRPKRERRPAAEKPETDA